MTSNIGKTIVEDNPGFFGWANSRFTQRGAEAILDTVITAYDTAHDLLSTPQPTRNISLGFTREIGRALVSGRALGSESKISLTLSEDTSLNESLAQIPGVMIHEVAHITHDQLNSTFRLDGDINNANWRHTLMEGVAMHAGVETGFDLRFKQTEPDEVIIDAIKSALRMPSIERADTIDDFIVGDHSFPSRGYKAGQFILARFTENRLLSLNEVFQTPLSEFTDFVESTIL